MRNHLKFAPILSLLLLIGTVIYPVQVSAVDDEFYNIGDYWEYQMSYVEVYNITVNMSLNIEIMNTKEENIRFVPTELFELELWGSGSYKDENGTQIINLSYSGKQSRLFENFNLHTQDREFTINRTNLTNIIPKERFSELGIGENNEYMPAIDDFFDSNQLSVGQKIESDTIVETNLRYDRPPYTETTIKLGEAPAHLTIEIVEDNVTVATFMGEVESCYKIYANYTNATVNASIVMYYSKEIRNYVKMEGDLNHTFGIPGKELILSSYGSVGKGVFDILTGQYLWATLLGMTAFIVAIVIVFSLRESKHSRAHAVHQSDVPAATKHKKRIRKKAKKKS